MSSHWLCWPSSTKRPPGKTFLRGIRRYEGFVLYAVFTEIEFLGWRVVLGLDFTRLLPLKRVRIHIPTRSPCQCYFTQILAGTGCRPFQTFLKEWPRISISWLELIIFTHVRCSSHLYFLFYELFIYNLFCLFVNLVIFSYKCSLYIININPLSLCIVKIIFILKT